MDDFCSQVIDAMTVDRKVSDGIRNMMQSLYAEQKHLDFTTNSALYALIIANLPKDAIASLQKCYFTQYFCPDRLKNEGI